MTIVRRVDVCAAVVGDLAIDARVWREARSLTEAGLRVALIGCRYEIDRTREREEDGIVVVEVPLGSRSRPVSVVRRAGALARLWWEVLRTGARVYHCHNVHPGPAASMSAWLRRADLVYDGHELYGDMPAADPTGRQRAVARMLRAIEHLLVRRAAAVITTNQSRATVLAQRHKRADIEVLRNVPPLVPVITPLDPGYPPPGTSAPIPRRGICGGSRIPRNDRGPEGAPAIALRDCRFRAGA